MNDLRECRREVDRLVARRDAARDRLAADEARLASADALTAASREAQALLQAVAAEVQEIAHERIASVVSRCLDAVFGEGFYAFRIAFDRKRGKTEARLLFVRDGHEMDPADECSGGAVDVAAFALRLAVLTLQRPPLRRCLILDEPFRHLKPPEVLAPRVCALLETLAAEFDLQIVLVPSIDRHYQVGKVVRLGG
jgi:DNA repair exonuclease SbcCD ATPase subunit